MELLFPRASGGRKFASARPPEKVYVNLQITYGVENVRICTNID